MAISTLVNTMRSMAQPMISWLSKKSTKAIKQKRGCLATISTLN